MPNVVFFSFKEDDRGVVLTIKGRAGFKGSDLLNYSVTPEFSKDLTL